MSASMQSTLTEAQKSAADKWLGTVVLANNGMKMKIVGYRRFNDIGIAFEDGTIVRHKRIADFQKGMIAHPNLAVQHDFSSRIGVTGISREGIPMKIIAYRGVNDVDIEFADGTVSQHKQYHNFINGKVSHPKNDRSLQKVARVGERNVSKAGLEMEILEYRKCDDIDVLFVADGAIAKGKTYSCFKEGAIAHPNQAPCKNGNSRIGETSRANNGMKMTLIAYRGARDVDVQFEDGTIVEHKYYHEFRCGGIAYPEKNRIGEENIANNGMKMKIIAYRSFEDIDIEFENGSIEEHKNYHCFRKGKISCSHSPRIGETAVGNNGLKMEIIAYRKATDIDVKFEDGTVVKGKTYGAFKKRQMLHPCMNDDGTVKRPIRIGDVVATERAYINDDTAFFICECEKCGMKDILSVPEMKRHGCEGII